MPTYTRTKPTLVENPDFNPFAGPDPPSKVKEPYLKIFKENNDLSPEELQVWIKFIEWEEETDDTIDFKKMYVDICGGDLLAGLLLSQIVYWHLPDTYGNTKLRIKYNNKLWLVKKGTDWWEDIRMTRRQIDRALPILKKLKIIETEIHRFKGAPTTYIRLLKPKLAQLVLDLDKKNTTTESTDCTATCN